MTHGVHSTADFRRILALPTREHDWSVEQLAESVELLTREFRTPAGTMSLKPIQARALAEVALHGKLVGEIGAGMGKTLISALLFTLWGAQRGLLLVPAHLRTQTIEEWAKLTKHWQLLPLYDLDVSAAAGSHVRVVSYSSLSVVRFATFLEEWRPDVVVADESHYLARTLSARAKRFFRYLRAQKRAGRPVKYHPLSGTPRRKSLRECTTIYEAALWDESPFPIDYPDVEQWCFALDEGVRPDARLEPGALESLCSEQEIAAGLDGIRRGVRRRLVSTPGIIATSESAVGTPLTFQIRDIEVPEEVQEAMRKIRTEHALPTGERFEGGIVAWNHAREVATGFAYRWDPPAPEYWSLAKKGWLEFVSDAMEQGVVVGGVRRHLDSPLMVWNAVAAGYFGDPASIEEWTRWRDVRDQFEPNPVPTWISDYLVRDAEEWALKTGGIVWVAHTSAFTKADSTGIGGEGTEDDIGRLFTKIPYFGSGKQGEQIKSYHGPCVASARSHGTGKNLVQWHRALWLCFPSSGATAEQLAARHHRIGQLADEVRIEFYCHSRESFNAVRTAQRDAAFMEAINGNPQRITSSVILEADGRGFDPERYEARMSQATSEEDPMWSQNAGKT